MKRICNILFTLLLMLLVCACGSSAGPDSVVKEFSEAAKKLDWEAMSKGVKNGNFDSSIMETEDEMTAQLIEFFKGEAKKITYTIDKSSVDGDKGVVDVTYKFTDATPIVKATMADYFMKAMDMAMGGASEEDLGKLFFDIFKEKAKAESLAQTEATIQFSCTKDNGKWIIDSVPEEMTNVITCNFAAATAQLDNFGESGTSD